MRWVICPSADSWHNVMGRSWRTDNQSLCLGLSFLPGYLCLQFMLDESPKAGSQRAEGGLESHPLCFRLTEGGSKKGTYKQ